MTSTPAPNENPLPTPPSSEDPSIDIHLFHCGHGDSILVRLPENRWGLIDCYLPKQYGIRKTFFDFLEQNVKTLDFIIQTHPDRDHYHGMKEVIEHFLKKGEKIGFYVDTGLIAGRVRDLLLDRFSAKEYQDLQDSLEQWAASGDLQWRELSAPTDR